MSGYLASAYKLGVTECICNLRAEKWGDRRLPGAPWPASLAKIISSRFGKSPHLKKCGEE